MSEFTALLANVQQSIAAGRKSDAMAGYRQLLSMLPALPAEQQDSAHTSLRELYARLLSWQGAPQQTMQDKDASENKGAQEKDKGAQEKSSLIEREERRLTGTP